MTGQVKALQDEGNALYAEGRYVAARAMYTQAIKLLTSSDGYASNSAPDTADSASWKALTSSLMYANRAQTAIQERDFAAALCDATLALQHNPKNEKAMLRKLVALENLERFEVALQLVESVLDRGEKNTPKVFQYCVAARRRLRKNIAKDREVAAAEVKQMGKMVHDKQQLRINFGCLLPSQVPLDLFFDVTVNIGNEFGLFRRDYVKSGEHIYLQCSLRNNTDGRYKLVFQGPLNPSDDGDAGRSDPDGKLTLNNRGKMSFRVAIAMVDGSGIGGKLWDSCLVLTRYLSTRRELLAGKQVIELGSGLGLVGIFCAMLGAHVTLTDMEEVIPLLAYNIALNFPGLEQDGASTSQSFAKGDAVVLPVAKAHPWGEPPRDLPSHADVLVLSDVVYDPEGYVPLVKSLEALATSPETLVLMAHRSRNPMEYQFFELLSRAFSCEQIDWLSTEKSAPKAGTDAGPPHAKQALHDVKFFVIRRLSAQ
ncbi:hypothetical protein JM16_003543 [Phytophthora kernoviae]|uniref:Uncharacterized protein n=1 Tax=Phytophthora kernoviae TaxID=325452 RepID=A0A8T0LTV4_9STRA|nr:hypothetical protein JM16_003543 [Phytophthora kernoviae]